MPGAEEPVSELVDGLSVGAGTGPLGDRLDDVAPVEGRCLPGETLSTGEILEQRFADRRRRIR